MRWAWRLFRREWRQQFLILALIVVAVAATILGSAVAVNNPPPKDAGFGTAPYSATFATDDAQGADVHREVEHARHASQVIENETCSDPGLDQHLSTARHRAAPGPFGGPMLSLVSAATIPSGADQVAVTSGVASAFHLSVGKHLAGRRRHARGRRHRAEPAEPSRRVRLGRPGSGDEAHAGHGALRRAG